ncbi:MAG: hypothetical protein M3Q23_08105 [Actinomycetota bacterium]|nr:hypothetical protein [Actinomycetota bacterium]
MSQTLDAEPATASTPTAEPDSESVDDVLEGFVPIENWRLRGLVRKLWWIQLALIPVDWALFDRLGAPGLKLVLILTPHVFVSIASLLAYRCLERIRDDVLRALWQRGVIARRERRADSMRPGSKDDDIKGTGSAPRMRSEALPLIRHSIDIQYTAFIRRLQYRLNRWWPGLGLGLLLGLLFYAFFPSVGFRWGFPLAHPLHVADLHPVARGLLTVDLAIQFLLVVAIGFVAVRLIVLARAVRDLAADFDLCLLRQHPDKCGGLAPLGGLCLSIAVIWGVVAVYPSAWLLMLRAGSFRETNFFALAHLTPKSNGLLSRVAALQDAVANLSQNTPKAVLSSKTAMLQATLDLESRVTHHALSWLTAYVVIVFALTFAFAVLTFFVPLYFVHRAMVRQHPDLYAEAAVIGKRINVFAEAIGRAAARLELAPATSPPSEGSSVGPEENADETASRDVAHPVKHEEQEEFDSLVKRLDSLRDAHSRSSFIPRWPFDVKVFAKFVGATVIPLTGITVWLPAIIGKLVSH